MNTYDYIIAGAGAAGLSLLARMIQSGKFHDKKILVVDKGQKKTNDRTWCFWEKDEDIFESIVRKQWDKLWFHSADYSGLHDISPYRYKLIRGIDFYNYCFKLIGEQPNITQLYGHIDQCVSNDRETYVLVNGEKIASSYIFNSIMPLSRPQASKSHYLLQHFKGWLIETPAPSFDQESATLMDFRVGQQNGSAFVYTLPLSPTQALVEYTLFSKNLLPSQEYDQALTDYCKETLGLQQYRITADEYGVIPMTDYAFPLQEGRIYYIGTAGGQTKASTGYTFRFIQKQSEELTRSLISTGKPFSRRPSRRFAGYDSVLLNVLSGNKFPGDKIFSLLFKHNDMRKVLKFLDNDSAVWEEMGIISALPKRIFLRAAIEEWRK